MFTGIIEEVGTLKAIERGRESARLTVDAPLVSQGTELGDSIAINGACLTVVAIDRGSLSFDAIPETLSRTSLKTARQGDGVNLERAIAAGQRFGGHLVQGHVDGTGELVSIAPADNARILRISAAPDRMRYVIPKGSIALDGISLTVVEVTQDSFSVWIIPHTWTHTNLRQRRPGDVLNIENDMIARYLEKLVQTAGPNAISLEKLVAAGF